MYEALSGNNLLKIVSDMCVRFELIPSMISFKMVSGVALELLKI